MRCVCAILSRLLPRGRSFNDVSSALNIEDDNREEGRSDPISGDVRFPRAVTALYSTSSPLSRRRAPWRDPIAPSVADTKWHLPDKGYPWTSHSGGRRRGGAAWTRFLPALPGPRRAQPTKPPPWPGAAPAASVADRETPSAAASGWRALSAIGAWLYLAPSTFPPPCRGNNPVFSPLRARTKRGVRERAREDRRRWRRRRRRRRGGCDSVATFRGGMLHRGNRHAKQRERVFAK